MPQTEDMNIKNRTRAQKVRSILLKIAGAIILAVVLFMAVIFAVDKISSRSEQKRIEHYGQQVSIDGKNMNVLIQGEGEETIVLLPGYGTAAPALDFKSLIEELSPSYKVVVVEPFGYGLSDDTKKDRSTANIVSEVHEALQSLGIDRYILMGHSIAGIYGLDYVNKYPDEVIAFAGIDSSVPTQSGMDVKFPINKLKFLKNSGLARLLLKVSGDPYAQLPFDDETKKQMNLIMLKNLYNSSSMNEMEHIYPNFVAASNLRFPESIPLLLFVQAHDMAREDWISLHEEQAKESRYGKVIPLEGDHYLHHTRSIEIAEGLKEFMNDIGSKVK